MSSDPWEDHLRLSEKANFVESDHQAIHHLALVQGILLEYLDKFVKVTNSDPDVLALWEVAKGLNNAVEVYCE